jgi:hypothetical protein
LTISNCTYTSMCHWHRNCTCYQLSMHTFGMICQ